jgi:hypothetical protein
MATRKGEMPSSEEIEALSPANDERYDIETEIAADQEHAYIDATGALANASLLLTFEPTRHGDIGTVWPKKHARRTLAAICEQVLHQIAQADEIERNEDRKIQAQVKRTLH